MARENMQKKINRLAACVVHLSDTMKAFADALEIKVPTIDRQLVAMEELAFGCVPGDHKNDFGLCLAGIKGGQIVADEQQTPGQDAQGAALAQTSQT